MMVYNGLAWEGMTSPATPDERRLESEAGGSFITSETCLGLPCLRNEGAVCAHAPVDLVLHRARGRRLPAPWV